MKLVYGSGKLLLGFPSYFPRLPRPSNSWSPMYKNKCLPMYCNHDMYIVYRGWMRSQICYSSLYCLSTLISSQTCMNDGRFWAAWLEPLTGYSTVTPFYLIIVSSSMFWIGGVSLLLLFMSVCTSSWVTFRVDDEYNNFEFPLISWQVVMASSKYIVHQRTITSIPSLNPSLLHRPSFCKTNSPSSRHEKAPITQPSFQHARLHNPPRSPPFLSFHKPPSQHPHQILYTLIQPIKKIKNKNPHKYIIPGRKGLT